MKKTLAIQKVVEKAIEGGYELPYIYATLEVTENFLYFYTKDGHRFDVATATVLMDRMFWQNLGKVFGWDKGKTYTYTNPPRRQGMVTRKGLVEFDVPEHTVTRTSRSYPDRWKRYWHAFVDHIASGKTVESFFKNL